MQFAKYLHCWLFQLGQNTRSVQNCIWWRGERKKKKATADRQMSFICPWAQCPQSRWLDSHEKLYNCNRKRVISFGGLPSTTFTFSLCIHMLLLFEKALVIQRVTWWINDTSAATGIKPVTFQLGTEPASPPGLRAPSGEMFFDHSCMLATECLP